MRNALMAAVLLLGVFGVCGARGDTGGDDDRTLTIEIGDRQFQHAARDLLARADLETVTIRDVSAYPRQDMTFQAIKLATLLEPLPTEPGSSVEFAARDGFTANLDLALLENISPNAAIAYLAIEDPRSPWPPHVSGRGSAGPFYLFWVNPERSDIGREEWPFMFNTIRVRAPLAELYPGIVPAASGAGAERISAGFRVYVKNCLACHKLNRTGPGAVGPDLNYPMSPVEYLREGVLERFIRNPQNIRANPRTPMGPFPEELISEQELDQLIAYLEYMAEHR
jgi:mono/diheme cytochrome c family protein